MVTFLVAGDDELVDASSCATRAAPNGCGAFWFLALSEIGFLLIVAAFVILLAKTGATELDVMAASRPTWCRAGAWLLDLLALTGFGFKAVLVPLHVWLPEAYRAAR